MIPLDPELRRRLTQLVLDEGKGLLANPKKVENLLMDLCPTSGPAIGVVAATLVAGVPEMLENPHVPLDVSVKKAVEAIQRRHAFSTEVALWGVATVGHAMGIVVPETRPPASATPSATAAPIPGPTVQSPPPLVVPPAPKRSWAVWSIAAVGILAAGGLGMRQLSAKPGEEKGPPAEATPKPDPMPSVPPEPAGPSPLVVSDVKRAKGILNDVVEAFLRIRDLQGKGLLKAAEAQQNVKVLKGRLEEALALAEKSIRTEPDYRDAWLQKAYALFYLHRHDEASQTVAEAKKRFGPAADFTELQRTIARR